MRHSSRSSNASFTGLSDYLALETEINNESHVEATMESHDYECVYCKQSSPHANATDATAQIEHSAELPAPQAGTVSTATNTEVSVLMRKWLDTALQLRAVPNAEFTMSDDSAEADWEAWVHAAGRAVR